MHSPARPRRPRPSPLDPAEQKALQDCVDVVAEDFSSDNVSALLIILSMLVRDRLAAATIHPLPGAP